MLSSYPHTIIFCKKIFFQENYLSTLHKYGINIIGTIKYRMFIKPGIFHPIVIAELDYLNVQQFGTNM